jgi:hypothetical protein
MIWMLAREGIPDEDNGDAHLPLVPGYSIAEIAQRFYHEHQGSIAPSSSVPPPPPPQETPKIIIPDDPQNVHDHGVTRSLKKKLQSLSPPETLPENSMEEVRAYILDSETATAETKRDALEALDSLSGTEHSVVGMSEQDVLHRVWGSSETNNTKDILVTQLASSVEHGGVVCSTGKIGRLVGTFDGIDDTPIRPLWAIREEIGTLAASIRDQGKTPEDFKASCLETYVKDLDMNPDIISSIIEEYSPHI